MCDEDYDDADPDASSDHPDAPKPPSMGDEEGESPETKVKMRTPSGNSLVYWR